MDNCSHLDIATIDPGVRRLVALLNAHGFTTTDSGDGNTKVEDMECALDFPHVAVQLDGEPGEWVSETIRLAAVLRRCGAQVTSGTVQLAWCPVDNEAMVLVSGVADKDLAAPS